ncbi:hypothetical protein AVEN_211492-1 [Araneus ventricosus]|uniref:Uncharacterized protein n=1 Tax=Araneus ventricosus TaxID=182803 RepID=A0A4Y2UQW5_ARAVE|nr:hypothetical protein AVEN_211492-1 [Araneus ventricosus]
MLSAAHKVFDPIRYTAPVLLCPKLMLLEAWKMSIRWDTEITGDLRKEFLQWFQDLKIFGEIHIFRWINVTAENLKHCTIHTFCDASKEAYAAVVFLRLEEEGSVKLSLLAAKSRISPLRGGTYGTVSCLGRNKANKFSYWSIELEGSKMLLLERFHYCTRMGYLERKIGQYLSEIEFRRYEN